MATYCKAFLARDLRQFSGWPSEEAIRAPGVDGAEPQSGQPDSEEAILFLHDNYVVTDGGSRSEKIVFDKVTPEWIEFCARTLMFTVPDYRNKTDGNQANSGKLLTE